LGNIIFLFIIELIVHYKKNGSRSESTAESKKKIVFCTKVFVVAEILAVLGLFTWVIIVKKENKDNKDKEVLRKMRIA